MLLTELTLNIKLIEISSKIEKEPLNVGSHEIGRKLSLFCYEVFVPRPSSYINLYSGKPLRFNLFIPLEFVE